MGAGQCRQGRAFANRPDKHAACDGVLVGCLNLTKEGQRRADQNAGAVCESSCVCPPSASEPVLPCLTAHFVRCPGWPPSAISETRNATTVRAARGAPATSSRKRRVCCEVRSTEHGPDNPASEAGRDCQQTFPQAGKPVPLCQSLRVVARSVWSGTELGGAGESALIFEPV